jgi:cell division protein FtsQ
MATETIERPPVPRPKIDPRIRARRTDVMRTAGRRRLRRLIGVTSLFLVVLGGWALSHSSLVDIDRIEVHGLDRLSLRTAEEATGLALGDDMLWLDVDEASARLEALPWVREATVERRWPGVIRIDVVERTAVALALAEGEAWVLVDVDGRVLTQPMDSPPNLPRLSGLHGAGPPGSYLSDDADAPLAVVPVLGPELALKVQGLWRDGRGELHLSLVTGDEVILGDDRDLRAKVAAIVTMVEMLQAQDRQAWILDVSVPNLPVVVDPMGEADRLEQAIAGGLLPQKEAEPDTADSDIADSDTTAKITVLESSEVEG